MQISWGLRLTLTDRIARGLRPEPIGSAFYSRIANSERTLWPTEPMSVSGVGRIPSCARYRTGIDWAGTHLDRRTSTSGFSMSAARMHAIEIRFHQLERTRTGTHGRQGGAPNVTSDAEA